MADQSPLTGCCLELCLLSGVAVCACVNPAPRAPYTHHLRSVAPWFVKGLRWFDELLRRREHLVAEPVPRRSAHCAFRHTLLCSVSRDRALDCSGSSSSRRHPSQVISLSTDAIVVWFSLLRSPGLAPAEALLRLSAAVAAAFGCVPRGQRALLDADTLELIDRSTCLVEPVSVWSLVLLPCLCCSPQQARPAPRPVANSPSARPCGRSSAP